MARRTYSGEEVRKVLVNYGPFRLHDITGSHYILRWDAPEDHDTPSRTVVVPDHDELRPGTLREIATQAGAKDFQAFLDWLDRNL